MTTCIMVRKAVKLMQLLSTCLGLEGCCCVTFISVPQLKLWSSPIVGWEGSVCNHFPSVWWHFPRVQEFWENVQQFIPLQHVFFIFYFHWVKGLYVCRCNLPPALLAEWLGSFTCHCSNTGVGQTPNKSQHTKLTLDKKILPPLLPGFEFATFRLQVQRFNQQVTPAPVPLCILSYRHVQCYSTHWHLRSNLGDFNNRVCHVMKIIITESNPDVGL